MAQGTAIGKEIWIMDVKKEKSFVRGQQAWEFHLVKSLKMLSAWRVTAVISIVCLLFTLIFAFYHASKPKMVPYVVTVTEDGEVDYRGVVHSQSLSVNDAVVRHYLIRFVTNIRMISSDIVVIKKQLVDAYYLSSPNCQRQLTEMIQETKPFEQARDEVRRDVKFVLFEKIAEGSWRCEWIEYVREKGVLIDKTAMSGSFTYTTAYPEDELTAETNPFGFYFTEFFISQKRA